MGESYVRPVLVGSEPPRHWVGVWRFRVLALIVLVVLTLGVIQVINVVITGSTRQDPTFNDQVTPSPAAAVLQR